MRLHKVKISGHYLVKNSGWFSVPSTKTILAGPHGSGKTTILRALQSINPPASGGSVSPFDSFPQYTMKGGHRRKVIPAKKTAVITVFICDEALRSELVKIDPVFYETDRIELGRRLDNSRWTTFIEIASSTRWSEVSEDMVGLKELLSTSGQAQELIEQYNSLTKLQQTDRLKDEIADWLEDWLSRIEYLMDESHRALLERTRFKVQRAQRFKKAKKLVAQRLPLFIYFSDSFLVREKIDLREIAQKAVKDHFYMDNDFGSFCFLKALSLKPEALADLKTHQGERELQRLDSSCAEFSLIIEPFLPKNLQFSLHLRPLGNELHILVRDHDGNETPLNQQEVKIIWLISLFSVIIALAQNPADHNIILLLDEPGKDLNPANQKIIKAAINRMSKSFQIVYSTETPAMVSKSDLKNLRAASVKDKEIGTIVSKVASMDEFSHVLETA